jgi:hypothetical protein
MSLDTLILAEAIALVIYGIVWLAILYHFRRR